MHGSHPEFRRQQAVPTINVQVTVFESGQSDKLTGARFTIEYAPGRTAAISMMEMPALSSDVPFEDFRAELNRLCNALREASQSAENILMRARA
jgi:hypothetical protein